MKKQQCKDCKWFLAVYGGCCRCPTDYLKVDMEHGCKFWRARCIKILNDPLSVNATMKVNIPRS
jgi:sulfatase maturation enzyme AslB (radical SAM superfamily)